VRVFYHCYGGTHSSVVAAALHTGRLDPARRPTVREIMELPLFDRVKNCELGRVFHYGSGPGGEEVYVVGFGPGREVVRRAIISFLQIRGVPARNYLFVNALARVGLVVRVGGMLSRRLGLIRAGRPLAAWGLVRSYRSLVSLVDETRIEVRRRLEGSSLTAFSPGR